MKEKVIYVMSGTPHLCYLIASLKTLREHYDGDVVVYAWPETFDIVQTIAEDDRLRIEARLWTPAWRGKNAQFACKQLVMQAVDAEVTLYLDADTTIHGNLNLLFADAKNYGFACTQFNDWDTSGGIVRKRIERLYGIDEIEQEFVVNALAYNWPSPNGGIFACQPTSQVLAVWHHWTMKAIEKKIFIADETALHAIMAKYVPKNMMTVIKGGYYNCSPKYIPTNLFDEEIRIWHYHGDQNLRPNKSPKGVALWWPIWQRCLSENIGGVLGWRHEIGNKYLTKLSKERGSL